LEKAEGRRPLSFSFRFFPLAKWTPHNIRKDRDAYFAQLLIFTHIKVCPGFKEVILQNTGDDFPDFFIKSFLTFIHLTKIIDQSLYFSYCIFKVGII
jgi:hypothetical protein